MRIYALPLRRAVACRLLWVAWPVVVICGIEVDSVGRVDVPYAKNKNAYGELTSGIRERCLGYIWVNPKQQIAYGESTCGIRKKQKNYLMQFRFRLL